MRRVSLTLLVAVAASAMAPGASQAQATSRMCAGQAGETPGPACLVAHQDLGALPAGPLYWNIYTLADAALTDRVRPPQGVVVQAFGQVWLFDVGGKGREVAGARHVADVGPLPMEARRGTSASSI